MSKLEDLKDELQKAAGMLPRKEAWEKGLCVQCRQPALPKCYSDLGRKEYRISGMCEACFDEMFKARKKIQAMEPL